jgi:hypothetical protein
MHGMSIQGETVAQVLAALRARHVSAGRYNTSRHNIAVNLRHVPGSYYVYSALPWAPGQVILFVGPTRTQPAPQAPVRKGHDGIQPKASPTP